MTDGITASSDSHIPSPPFLIGPYDDLLDRATHRLGGDPELQREVRQELEGHLEDAAAEHRAAGLSDIESREKARAALGDASRLSVELFETHRPRLVQRRVIKWTFGVALIPAVIAVTVAVGWSAVLSLGVSTARQLANERDKSNFVVRTANRLTQMSYERQLSRLKLDDRLLAEAAYSAQLYRPLGEMAASARRLSDRWPQNRAYFAYSAAADWRALVFLAKDSVDPAAAQVVLDKLDRGEQLEQDNALYNILKAETFFLLSSSLVEFDNPRSGMSVAEHSIWKGQPMHGVTIHDQSAFDRGLREIRAASAKPYLTDHSNDLVQELRTFHQPDSLGQVFQTWPYPLFNGVNGCVLSIEAYALQLARENPTSVQPGAVTELLDHAVKIAKLGNIDQPSLYLEWTLSEILRYRFTAMRLLGRAEASVAAATEFHVREKRVGDLNREQGLDPALARLQHKAEEAVWGRFALGLLLALFAITAICLLVIAFARKIFDLFHVRSRPESRDATQLRFIFIGWRRLTRIGLFSILIPILIFAVWSQHGPFGWQDAGSRHVVIRSIELFAMIAVVHSLLWRLTDEAIRDRAAELGMHAPSTPRRPVVAFGILVLCLFGVTVVLLSLASWLGNVSQPHAAILHDWLWLPFTLPMVWIAENLIGRLSLMARGRRVAIVVAIVFIPMLVMSRIVSEYAVVFSLHIGLPIPTIYLVSAATVLAMVVFGLMNRFDIGKSKQTPPPATLGSFQQYWPASALPALGCAILVLGVFVGCPLRYIESSAAHEIDAKVIQFGKHDARP